ncbi:MAG: translocation/assembly module TamB domain-containing protein [Gemmatimonadales bacterium]|nr:translocation/assembly module TamB domain-containing protein [Gemmatimonadales bacterium]
MTLTPPGRALLARTVSTMLDRIVQGSVQVGAISGSFFYDLTLEDLVVRDTAGVLLADLPRARVGYRIPNFLAGQIVLSSVHLDRPTIQLIKHRGGRLNVEDILGLGKGKKGGPSPLVAFYDVRIHDGTFRIATPWNPDRSLKTEVERDSALRAERLKPGRVIEESPEGLRKIVQLSDLTTRLSRLRISTPDHLPLTIDIDSLAARVSDPGVTVRNAVGRLRIRGDSAVFSLSEGRLPDTRFSGGGAITWPHDTTLMDFQVVSPHVNLVDLRWVSPDFPALTGRGVLTARSVTGARTDYDIRDLHLRGPLGRVEGSLVAVTDRRRGLGVRDMKLTATALDLDAVRGYVDSLPFFGTVTGTVAGNGLLTGLDLGADIAFADAKVPGNPVTTIAGRGGIGATRDSGLTFTDFAVSRSDVDLHTVRRIAPAVILEGRLAAEGVLDGPLRNVAFNGTMRHQDGARPVSRVDGIVHLDTRFDTLGLRTNVVLAPLSMDGIRRAFPSLRTRGDLRGTFVSEGTLERLKVDAALTGDLGAVNANGFVTLQPPRWAAEDLLLRFSRLDLARLTGRDSMTTGLDGAVRVTGSIDTLRAPEGEMRLALRRSRVRAITLDTLFALAGMHDSVIRLDTAYAGWLGARAAGSGTLGYRAPHTGTMAFGITSDNLTGFDSLLLATTGQTRDTSPDARPLGGTARGSVQLAGSLDSLETSSQWTVDNFTWQRIRAPQLTGILTWLGGQRPQLTVSAGSDSINVAGYAFRKAGIQARGYADSLDWSAGTGIGTTAQIGGAGRWWASGRTSTMTFDSLTAQLSEHRYRLQAPATLALGDSSFALSPMSIAADDGSGSIDLAGTVPGDAAGRLAVRVLGLDLDDIYGLLRRDTAGVDGDIGLELTIGGTARRPTLEGTATIADGRFGSFRAPFLAGTLKYADRRFTTAISLWRTGDRVLQVEARLPLDLGFRGVTRRRLDGPLSVRARADSMDLGLLEAITPALTRVAGRLHADVQVEGTWEDPKLAGTVEVRGGAMSVPGLGVRFGTVRGGALLQGDSVLLKDVLLTSGGGDLLVDGGIHLENLSRPVFDLGLRAEHFRAIDLRNFLALTASGRLQLTGPLLGATLTGAITANSGVLYFADLVNKQVIDLEDPLNAALVDTTLIRQQGLGDKFQNLLLDSLAINNLRVQMGNDVWLRSGEANVQLDGTVTLDKSGAAYRPAGTLNALRGSYTLKIGPVTREFTVDRGAVTYFGDDLNAALDIQARHVVRPVQGGEDIPVIARIGGTLFDPRLTLESTLRPPISETDLVSYLITGYPANEATLLGQGGALQTGLAYFSSALSSELERALIQDIGVPLDLIEIRPGVTSGQVSGLTQLAAGWQLGRKTFITLNAGFCPDNLSQLSYQNLGAGLEFRFSHEWKLQGSVEPTLQTCSPRGGFNAITSTSRQIGLDILWEREF